MLYYLANVLPHTEDPDIYFKYIEACSRLGNYKEVERVIRETSNYDPEKVKDYLKEAKLPDPRPPISVICTTLLMSLQDIFTTISKTNSLKSTYSK